MNKVISANEYMPLSKVRDFIEVCGIYEILCLKTERVYIGQSKAVSWRASQHLLDLKNNRHSNKAMQRDWNDLVDPSCFVFRVVTPLDPLDEKALFRHEMKEIERRREYGVVLYNDTRIIRIVGEEVSTQHIVTPQKTTHDNGNNPYERKDYTWVINVNNATCTECGMVGYIGQDLFRSPDKELRCYKCNDNNSRRLEEWLRVERERIAKQFALEKRITSRRKMRWQMGFGSVKNNLVLAISRYVEKHGQFPSEAHFNPGCELPEMSNIEMKYNRHTPVGYLDLPEPDNE